MESDHALVELVRAATVVLLSGPLGAGDKQGSGFFIAPKRVVTCSHVLYAAGDQPHVLWDGKAVPATVLGAAPVGPTVEHGVERWDPPDVALLEVEIDGHPVAPLPSAPAAVKDDLYVYGITQVRSGPDRPPEPDGSSLTMASLAGTPTPGGEAAPFHKVSGGVIAGGMSGGPVLDITRRGVCGVMQSRLLEDVAKDGWVAPIEDALALAVDPAQLREQNRAEDPDGLLALRAEQRGYGTLPLKAARLLKAAVDGFETYLGDVECTRPPTVGDADLPEWVARQLFRLNLIQATAAIVENRAALGAGAVELFDLLTACLPAKETKAVSWWIPGDAAARLRAELQADTPRIVHVKTDATETLERLLLRTLERRTTLRPCGGPATPQSSAGLPVTVEDDIRAKVLDAAMATEEEWEEDRAEFIRNLRTLNVVLALDLGREVDKDLVASILARYAGVRFLLRGRSVTLPAAADDVLLVLLPEIDADFEGWGLKRIKQFNGLLGEARETT